MTPAELSRLFVSRFNKKKMYAISRESLLALGYEAGLASRSGFGPYVKKSTRPMKVFVKPKEQ